MLRQKNVSNCVFSARNAGSSHKRKNKLDKTKKAQFLISDICINTLAILEFSEMTDWLSNMKSEAR